MIPTITEKYVNNKNQTFSNVRHISYKKGELYGNLGKFVAETKHEPNNWFSSTDNLTEGVYVYQTYHDPNVAYRIYKCFADLGFNGYQDDILINELQKKQRLIKSTTFPTGVITLDGNIIGQEIPYFINNITLLELFKTYNNFDIVNIYLQVLSVLKEMYDNGILYLDNHPKNFMINPNLCDSKINTIDFERNFIRIDDWSKSDKEQFFSNYCTMINALNKIKELDIKLGKFVLTKSFDETYDEIEEMSKKLVK